MRNRINKLLAAALLLTISFVGCKKELDINQNPNQVTEGSTSAELILPNALHYTGLQTANGYGWLANWMGYWSPSGSFNPSTEESSYNITNTFQDVKWEGVYNVLFDLTKVEQKAIESEQPHFRSMAMIMKAHLYQNLVDIYGNVPYSQTFQPSEFPTPAYDKAEDIYKDLQGKLDTAIGLMKAATISPEEARYDIAFSGDKTLWVKLANTIKLRLLIRQSEISNPDLNAELAKIKAEGGVLQSGESADVNPGYTDAEDAKLNPFYRSYGLISKGTLEANTFYRANAYSINLLKTTGDPRIGYFFNPARNPTNPSNPFVGTVYGSDPDNAFNGDRTSNIGKGLVKRPDQEQWIITSVESMFLQAEAIARGWDVGGPYAGDPKAAYEAAVTESFIWLGVTNAATEAANYLQNASANWNNATTQEEKIRLIVTQKYISLMGINPLEAWNDYRRLGYPSNVPLSILPARGSRVIPVRLLYPASEFAVNATNVQAQGDVTTQSKIFWDK